VKVLRSWQHLQPRLLLSYLLVLAVGVGSLVVVAQLIGPSLFDRSLTRHMLDHGMMGPGMTASMRSDTTDAFQSAIFQALLVSMIIATLVAIGVSVFVTRRISAPITEMADVSHRIASGDYSARAEITEPEEMRVLAADLNTMAAALEATEQRRVHLIGDVAHEIRTPLTTLRGNLEALQDGIVEPTPELLAQLLDETLRLSRLVNDLQDLSRLESGVVELSITQVDPRQLIQRVVSRASVATEAQGISLRVEVPVGLPPVRADEDRTMQVLTNLLSNAVRHSTTGGTITVSALRDAAMVRFVVRDTGRGIAAEHLPNIFERFYRADASRSRAMGGSGVGLTIARALVEAQGGHIWAESPGLEQGATISFTLPAASDQ
jgi:signal transduction histidine kinase